MSANNSLGAAPFSKSQQANFRHIIWFEDVSLGDLAEVGGKNASLGEMISNLSASNVKVPNGFATRASSFLQFLEASGIDKLIQQTLNNLNVEDLTALQQAGARLRQAILDAELPAQLQQEITAAYQALTDGRDITVAVRSSATAEDLPEASFAGQQETLLNIHGIDNLLLAVKQVYASLFTDRAIAYRVHHNFDHSQVLLSVGVQRMIRSDKAASGVMFTLDTESGFDQVVFITAAYGLGELVVQGAINPDEYTVFKPNLTAGKPAILRRHLGSKMQRMIYADGSDINERVQIEAVSTDEQQQFALSDDEITKLAQHAMQIEQHYGRPMDIEWAKDGVDGEIYILQARPETVESRSDKQIIERYQLHPHDAKVVCEGRSIGQKIGKGEAKIIADPSQMHDFVAGQVLVADMTDPDWEPIMKQAAAIVTNRGGRTCHAAIIARELGIPAVVGCGDATETLQDGQQLTVSCAEGDTGYIYAGDLEFSVNRIALNEMPEIPLKIMLNVANPERAFAFSKMPNDGIGLARLEFIISTMIGVHPRACLEFASLPSNLQQQVLAHTAAYSDPVTYYITRLAEGIATLAAAFYPKPVIVRLSDFKSNEYAHLLGGSEFEPHEENPMLGFRGAGRYISDDFRDCFALECQAVKYVREEMGLTNVEVMIPFVRTLTEAKAVIDTCAANSLVRGENKLKFIMMCEIPSNALLADQFLEYFDGFSIGSNDLTQLTLGLDRDSGLVAASFDERDPAVKVLLETAIQACRKQNKYVGICGQGPSDHPDFARWLLLQGIESVSLNPDSVLETIMYLAQ